jgi:MerR family transcriptional regulator, thiopeptide resistance regulator
LDGHTVKQVAKLSGVSVRTLHYYDEVGLLKPAHVNANGYRHYGGDELLRLQQILFYRELGFSLDEIANVLDAKGFDLVAALRAHREKLAAAKRRYGRLVRTIDETLAALEGENVMNEKAMYRGFDLEKQERQEAWAIEHYGEAARWGIETRNRVMQGWSQADYDRSAYEFGTVVKDFAAALATALPSDSDRVQGIVRRLYSSASQAWTGPINRLGFLNMAELYSIHPEYRASFDSRAPGLAEYITDAMRTFAHPPSPDRGRARQ